MLALLAAALGAQSCDNKNNLQAAANDMCQCFNGIKDSLNPTSIAIFSRVAKADNAGEAYAAEIAKLDMADVQRLNKALMMAGTPGTKVYECLQGLDQRHKGVMPKTEAEATEKILAAMAGKDGCEIMVALLRMQAEKQKK